VVKDDPGAFQTCAQRVWRGLISALAIIGFTIAASNAPGADTYTDLIAELRRATPPNQKSIKERLARMVVRQFFSTQYGEMHYEFHVCEGNFVNPDNLDVAVAVSFQRSGSVVLLTERGGQFIPLRPLTGLAAIEKLQAVRLFPESQDQLLLHLFQAGSGWRHWANDVYRWDGQALRLVWAWARKDVYKGWPPTDQGEISGRLTQAGISFRDLDGDGVKEVLTDTLIEDGVIQNGWDHLTRVTARQETKRVHRWDKTLFYFVSKYGRILSPVIDAPCQEGIPPIKTRRNFPAGLRVGVLEIPGGPFLHASSSVLAITGKEHFCEMPTSSVGDM
jgi:hypothetical protein